MKVTMKGAREEERKGWKSERKGLCWESKVSPMCCTFSNMRKLVSSNKCTFEGAGKEWERKRDKRVRITFGPNDPSNLLFEAKFRDLETNASWQEKDKGRKEEKVAFSLIPSSSFYQYPFFLRSPRMTWIRLMNTILSSSLLPLFFLSRHKRLFIRAYNWLPILSGDERNEGKEKDPSGKNKKKGWLHFLLFLSFPFSHSISLSFFLVEPNQRLQF